MAKTKTSTKTETDSYYFLKLILYVLLGTFWLRLSDPIHVLGLNLGALPLGLVVGLLIASHDRFQIDRKVEYAVLVVVAIVSLFLPIGLVI